MNITFIGTGYVGLVSGTMLSYLGHNVTCLDTDKDKIAKLNQGILSIYEPTLDKYLHSGVKDGRLKFIDKYDENLQHSSAIFITVGTPSLPSGDANLQYVFEAIDNISKYVHKDCVIIIKSSIPPGASNQINEYIKSRNYRVTIALNPEFLREGCAVNDFLNPDRIVIGTSNHHSKNLLEEIYHPLTAQNIPLVSTDLTTAEFIKYGSNAFLAIKVAFINEIANLSETIGADIEKIAAGIGLDHRIGNKFLKAGPGFGGSCFPKDILALSSIAKQYKLNCKIVDAAIGANYQRPYDMVKKISQVIEGNSLKNKTIAVLGLAFKAATDDLRSSPAIEIIKILQSKGANIIAYDPVAMVNAGKFLPDIKYANSAIEAAANADAIVVITEWEEFKELDFDHLYKIVKSPIIVDLRNVMNADLLKQKGFKYYSIGRKDD